MKCAYVYCDKEEEKWERYKTYKGLDEHHNPPKFLCRGEVPNGNYWRGKTYFLCRKHHRELHDKILKILNRIAGTLKFVNSEHWALQRMNEEQIERAKKEVYDFTEEWIKGVENENRGCKEIL